MLYPHPAKTFDLSLSFHPQRNCNWFSTGRTFELRNVWRKVPKADVTLGTFRLRNVSLHLDVDAVSQETPSDCAYGHANWTKDRTQKSTCSRSLPTNRNSSNQRFCYFLHGQEVLDTLRIENHVICEVGDGVRDRYAVSLEDE